MKVKIDVLTKLMEKVVSSKYYSRSEARKIVEPLVFAVLSGKESQGLVKLFGPEPHQDMAPEKKVEVIKKTPVSAIVDGGGCAGTLAAQIACEKAIKIALKKGFALVGVTNTFSSIGVLGFYARKIAGKGLISLIAANSPRHVVHFPGTSPVYGTNPFCFGFPTLTNPIVFDASSSSIPFSSMVKARELGEKLPEGIAFDLNGEPTTESSEAIKGSVLSFDKSYKGSGLAMSVELLAGVYTNSSFVFDSGKWGSIFIVLSPGLLSNTDEFKKNASELVRKVKESNTRAGSKVKIPGFDNEEQIRKTIQSGYAEVTDLLYTRLLELAKNA